MPYTADKPPLPESSDELRARIPGWGADLDPRDRPSVPRCSPATSSRAARTGTLPEQQPERPASASGRSSTRGSRRCSGRPSPPPGCPARSVTLAYRRYSEGRAAHWLLLHRRRPGGRRGEPPRVVRSPAAPTTRSPRPACSRSRVPTRSRPGSARAGSTRTTCRSTPSSWPDRGCWPQASPSWPCVPWRGARRADSGARGPRDTGRTGTRAHRDTSAPGHTETGARRRPRALSSGPAPSRAGPPDRRPAPGGSPTPVGRRGRR